MRIAFFGTGEFGVPTFRDLHAAGHEIAVAISQPDRPAGRGRHVHPTAIRAVADGLGVPHVQTDDVNTLDPGEIAPGAELGVVVAFGQKIGPRWLAGLPRGCVNLHGSLLPRHRGAAPIQWAIIRGDERTGVTVFQLDQRWDNGPIWATGETAIGELETADELHDRLAELGAPVVLEALQRIAAGTAQPAAQNAALATRAPKLTKSDGYVDWNAPAREIVRRIHGLWSWPAAACQYISNTGRHERVQLARARVLDDTSPPGDATPGTFLPDHSVQAGRGRVQLLEIKPAGGSLMTFEAFANGRRLAAGDRLERADHDAATGA